ncbi:cation diffusion facilitator family transporter [Candidatus Poribacteria bacterium]
MAYQNGTDTNSNHGPAAKCLKCSNRVVWDNVWINFALSLAKGSVGFMAGSKALLADGLHSFSDVITSLVVALTLRIADRPSDEDHPYGYGKVEYIASLVVSIVLLVAALTICFSALRTILKKVPVQPNMLAAWVAAISIIANEFMFRRTICAANRLNSPSLRTNAWDNRVDCYSSVATLMGIIGARLGAHFLDPLAAIAIAIFIFRICGHMMWDALCGLTDVAISPEQIRQIYDITSRVDGVQSITDIRARRTGKLLWIDLKIHISSQQSITQGHLITTRIKEAIMGQVEHVGSVMVSVGAIEKHLAHKSIQFSEG